MRRVRQNNEHQGVRVDQPAHELLQHEAPQHEQQLLVLLLQVHQHHDLRLDRAEDDEDQVVLSDVEMEDSIVLNSVTMETVGVETDVREVVELKMMSPIILTPQTHEINELLHKES